MHVPVIFQPPGQVGQMSQTSGPVAAVGAMQQMKREMVQMQLENDDLRQRLLYLEAVTGTDSQMIREYASEDTSARVDWA